MSDTQETTTAAADAVTMSTQPEVIQAKATTSVALRDGSLAPKDASELSRTLANIAKGGGFPERFDTQEKRIAAYNLAQSLMGPQWQLALNHIAIIKGQMCIYGEMPGTLAERTGEVEEKEVYLLDADYQRINTTNKNLGAEPYAAVCNIKRKGRAKKEFTYTIDEAKKAGQYPPTKWSKQENKKVLNEDSPWEKFKKIMLMRKAMAIGIKFEFPDALVGVPIAEYDFDEAPDIKDVTPRTDSVDKAALLNNNFTQRDAHLATPVEAQQ